MRTKGPGYAKWAKAHNLKETAKDLIFLRERGIDYLDQLDAYVEDKKAQRDALLADVQAADARIEEIAALRKQIFNYSNTRSVYEAYRKAGYSRKFYEEHRADIEIHKAAKKAFDELGVRQIPRVKDLNVEFAEAVQAKKEAFREYKKVKAELQESLVVQENFVSLYRAEGKEKDTSQ